MYLLNSWYDLKIVNYDTNDTNLVRAKKCVLNNYLSATHNTRTIVDISTKSIESIIITKLSGQDLFIKIEDCESFLNKEEMKKLKNSQEIEIFNKFLYKQQKFLMGVTK